MRRKYDSINKRNFIIILIITIITIVVFSLFLYRYLKMSKIEYTVSSSSIVMDANKNYVSIDNDSKIKMKWNGNYYLLYNDKNINLGKKVVLYNEITGQITLYGTFYRITSDGKVIVCDGETIIPNSTDTGFYKIDDRRYLIVDRVIYNKDRTLETNNYLLVELDIQGNAKLSNNKINFKTLNETTILTSKYSFDIANEILNFSNYNIDLKKIIGTTNIYKKEEDKNDTSGNGNDSNSNEKTSDIIDNTPVEVINTGNIINGSDNDSSKVSDIIDNIKNKTKLTSVVSVREGITDISLDYVIYDPYNEYKSVYLEIQKGNNLEIIYLNKNNDTLNIKDLLPDTTYNLKFYYTYIDGNNVLAKELFDNIDVTTVKPKYDISVYRISKVTNKLTYKVNLQSGFSINKVFVSLSFNSVRREYNESGELVVSYEPVKLFDTINVTGTPQYLLGIFDISNYSIDDGTRFYLTLYQVNYGNNNISYSDTSTFIIGG